MAVNLRTHGTLVSTLLHAAPVANIMQLVQNNIVNLPVFRNSYFQRSYLHSLFSGALLHGSTHTVGTQIYRHP